MYMCSTNLATQKPCVAPLNHFYKVAARLGLTQQQLTQLRVMLQQYNRSMQQQLQDGLGLLQVSNDIAGVQTAVVTAEAASGQGSAADVKQESSAAAAAGAAANGFAEGAAALRADELDTLGGLKQQQSNGAGMRSATTSTVQLKQQQSSHNSGSGSGQGSGSNEGSGSGSNASEEVSAQGLTTQLQQHLEERMRVMQVG
jgi:hypothetical protein